MTNKTQKPVKQLNEIRLSWSGKLLMAAIATRLAAYGMRKFANSLEEQNEPQEEEEQADFPFKLQGTPEQLSAIMKVVQASKEFQEEMTRPDATVESTIQKLNDRNVAKEEFKENTGYDWPL
jgi:outer membrane protein assembly factor BamA